MHPQSDLASPAFSAHSHPHPLNQHSALLSTPAALATPSHQVVHFEEFQLSEERPSLKAQGRKRLTIEVEEHYEYEQISMQVVEPSPNCESSLNLLPAVQKAADCEVLRQRLMAVDRERQRVAEENELLRGLLRKKEEQLVGQAERNEQLQLRVAQLEAEAVQDRFYDEKLREKEGKLR